LARDRKKSLMPSRRYMHESARRLIVGVIFAIAISAGCVAGCSSLWQVKPSPAAATSQISQIGSPAQATSAAVPPKEELQVHCEQLARSAPGLEELRMNQDGTIESRQWTLIARDSSPRWAVVRPKNQAPQGWTPKPGIGKLNFNPPIQPVLAKSKGVGQFVAYAPVDVKDYDDLEAMATLNEVFGAPQGRFQWRGRAYGYALAKELPCYPPQ
jgi:hypothetical protein